MDHPLARLINGTDRFVVIADSSEGRFPAASYAAYTQAGKPFYCLDLGGLEVSRGRVSGGKVYRSVAELPNDRADLAVIWVKPRSAKRAVDVAHEAGCTRVWFSFQTGHAEAVEHARSLGIEVVEIGRCPVYYLDGDVGAACLWHTRLAKLTGNVGKPPQLEAGGKHRELI
ncbi:MAG: CoA-binding protein [Deltaproteobacteria bacterium]|nr:CoA-binding protein [Deltaproteobacteria bacterium]